MRNLTVLLTVLMLAACSGSDHMGGSGDHAGHQPPLSEAKNFSPDDIEQWLTHNGSDVKVAVIDVRDPQAFAEGHVTGARNIPAADVADHMQELDSYDHVVMVCNHGGRSSRAAVACAKGGANAGYLKLEDWKAAHKPLSFGGWEK